MFDVWYKKGVTDSVGFTIEKSIKTLKIDATIKVRTRKRYILEKKHDKVFFENIVKKLFTNSVINDYFLV